MTDGVARTLLDFGNRRGGGLGAALPPRALATTIPQPEPRRGLPRRAGLPTASSGVAPAAHLW